VRDVGHGAPAGAAICEAALAASGRTASTVAGNATIATKVTTAIATAATAGKARGTEGS
jgi:hypothetical protein